MSPDPLSEATRALAQFLVAESSLHEALQRVADIARDAIEPVKHVGISMFDEHGEATTGVFTDETAPDVDAVQYELGDGPCLTAWREKRVVRVADMAHPNGQFEEFCRAATAHGVASSLSLPLMAADRGIGALNLYGDVAGAFSDNHERLATDLATTAAALLANASAYWGAHRLSENMRAAMESRSVIEQAKGILMATTSGTDADSAFELLVRASQRENVKLRDIARRIVDERGSAAS